MTLLKRDTRIHTYADYFKWSGTHSHELVDGTAYVREPPSQARLHQEMVGELYHQVRNALEGRPLRAYVAPFDVRLPKSTEEDDQIDTVLQPDVLIVSDLRKLDARGMRGAPDWVAEVLSPNTADYDRKVKVRVYERAGVPEVWLTHPLDRTLTVYRLEAGTYGKPLVLELKGKTPLTATPDVTIDWEEMLARIS